MKPLSAAISITEIIWIYASQVSQKDVSRNQVFYGHKNDYSMQKMNTRVTSASISPEIMISVGIEVDEFAQIRLI